MASASASAPLPNLHPMLLLLDQNNYAFWRIQILSTICAHGFDDFISSTVAAPLPFLPSPSTADLVPNPVYSQWIRKDHFLMSWMLSSISESMLGHVVQCITSQQIWSVLENLFQSQSRARVLQLKKMLHSQKKGSISVDEYFMKMCSYADQLSATGHLIPDEELGDSILNGFGPDYESVVVNLMHRVESPSLREMQYALQSHEIRLQQSTYSIADPMAHYVHRG